MTSERSRSMSPCGSDPVADLEAPHATLRSFDPDPSPRRGKKRPATGEAAFDPSKLTEDALRQAALSYLDKRDASVEQLRRVLLRRVARFAPATAADEPTKHIEALLVRFCENGLLSDERYALALSESLRRRGNSTLKIRAKLRARGIDAGQIGDVLAQAGPSCEVESAEAYARRRRLSSRYDLSDAKERQKALAALARQGFSFDVAKRALGL